jgi:hypothetical protein
MKKSGRPANVAPKSSVNRIQNFKRCLLIMTTTNNSPPKVFISYSHDSPEHRTRVLAFAEKLRGNGIEAWIDQYESWPEQGWPIWMEKHISESDFVLMVCTESYYRRVSRQEEPGVGLGVCWEAGLIYNELYSERLNNKKFIPVFFNETKADFLPKPLRAYSSYLVDQEEEFQKLYAVLTGQPAVQPVPLGTVQSKQPYKYFISYSHKNSNDENLARFLYEKLSLIGHSVFIDISMKAGTDWVEEIQSRIKWCDYLVVLLSKTSMRSEMLLREVRMACTGLRENGKPKILPVRLNYEGPLEYELDLHIGHLHYVLWQGLQDSQYVLDNITESPKTFAYKLEKDEKPSSTEIRHAEDRLDHAPCYAPDYAMDLRLLSMRDVIEGDSQYISRPEDKKILAAAHEIGETIVIKGPNQMGKTSLLARYIQECKKAGKKTAVIDFAIFGKDVLSSYTALLSDLAGAINEELDINEGAFPEIKSQTNMVSYVRKSILDATTGHLTIAFDEVDRVMGQPYSSDFFTMLRSFHNSRPRTRWGETDLVLVISTEPYLLITEAERSPFNVVPPLIVNPFTFEEYSALNKTYENPLNEEQLDGLYKLLQGHPYLTRLAYDLLKDTKNYSLDELIERADDERGPFGEHLRAKLADLQTKPKLLGEMKKVLIPGTQVDRDMAYRLCGSGLISFTDHGQAVPANLLYYRYFKKVLND